MVSAVKPMFALDILLRTRQSNYPVQFVGRVAGRQKRALGDAFGLTRYGVNLTILPPGVQSALLHRHTDQEEFIYILQGLPTLLTDDAEVELAPGMCVGFRPNEVAQIRREAGEIEYQLLNAACNQWRIIHFSRRTSLDYARGFLGSPRLVAIRCQAGIHAPGVQYLHSLETAVL